MNSSSIATTQRSVLHYPQMYDTFCAKLCLEEKTSKSSCITSTALKWTYKDAPESHVYFDINNMSYGALQPDLLYFSQHLSNTTFC